MSIVSLMCLLMNMRKFLNMFKLCVVINVHISDMIEHRLSAFSLYVYNLLDKHQVLHEYDKNILSILQN